MKKDLITLKGKIVKILPNAMYRVVLEPSQKEILCYLCGKMSKKFIKLELADTVSVEIAPVDLEKGRIMKRLS
jgi:translation initiation factor IF-1